MTEQRGKPYNRIEDSKHSGSSPGLKECPKPTLPEHAFIGRSNVGKSSLINMLTGRRNLAHTSSTPGKTRLINHYLIDGSWYLADLPGYGYARVSKTERLQWPAMIRNYLEKRLNLLNTFILIDSRLEPQSIDMEFLRWMGEKSLPFCIVFTKCDKLSRSKLDAAITAYLKALQEEWEPLPPIFRTSATTGTGREEILKLITETNKLWKNQ